jgi:Zn-dependent protease
LLLTYSSLISYGLSIFLTFAAAAVFALVAGITFHEFSHAVTALYLGDHTAESRGRVSLDPRRHLEPIGAFLICLVGFGWGKPTPVNPYQLRHGPKTGRAIVSAAGPVSNILLAATAAIPIRLGIVHWMTPFPVLLRFSNGFVAGVPDVSNWSVKEFAGLFLSALIVFNVVLAVFNLLPIAPLDGFSVALGLLPRDLAMSFARLEQYGPGILLLLIALPFLTNGRYGVLFKIMSPFINAIINGLTGAHQVFT